MLCCNSSHIVAFTSVHIARALCCCGARWQVCPGPSADGTSTYEGPCSASSDSFAGLLLWDVCKEGYGGVVCAVCVEGYQQESDFSCTKCPGVAANWLRFVATVAGVLVGALVVQAVATRAAHAFAKLVVAPRRSEAAEVDAAPGNRHAKQAGVRMKVRRLAALRAAASFRGIAAFDMLWCCGNHPTQ